MSNIITKQKNFFKTISCVTRSMPTVFFSDTQIVRKLYTVVSKVFIRYFVTDTV